MKPTAEQQQIIRANEPVIKAVAFAGTGKTSTFIERAKAHVKRTLYLAFNKSVQLEAEGRFPKHVTCLTQHGLAFSKVMRGTFNGVRYQLGKLSIFKTAKFFKVDFYMASLIHKTITNFCHSADREITKAHAEPDVIGRFTYDISDVLVKQAQEIWSLMVAGRTPEYPMTHDGYLKLFQLSNPRLGYEVIMLDEAQDTNPVVHDIVLSQRQYGTQLILTGDPYQQIYCQPAGSSVAVVTKPGNGKTGVTEFCHVSIEDIKVSDRLAGYNLHSGYAVKTGCQVTKVGQREFSGTMVTVSVGDLKSRYTADHHCVIRIADAFVGKHVVYLMRQGNSYRLGRTTWRSYSQNNQLGCMFRARQEDADAWWVVEVDDTKEEAARTELKLSWHYSIPTVTFNASKSHIIGQDGLDMFWADIGDNSADAAELIKECGKDIQHPLWTKNTGNLLVRRPIVTAAINVEIGMEVMLESKVTSNRGKRISKSAWSKISWVDLEDYTGTVYSLEVEGSHTYFSDGILTHNCWRGAVDALGKVDAATYYITQSFRFGPQVAGVANHILNAFFNETRPLVGLGAAGTVEGLGVDFDNGDEPTKPTEYTFLARTNAYLFAEASRQAGKVKMHVPGSGQYGELPIFQSVLDVFALYQASGERDRDKKFNLLKSIRDLELRNFADYWELLEFTKTGQADPEWTVSVAMVEKYKEGIPAQIEKIRNSLVQRPEDAQVILITAHRAKGLEWDNVVLGSDYAEMFDDDGKIRKIGDDRKTQIAHDEVNLTYVAATRAKKHLTLNRQLAQLLTYRATSNA
jgi:hypothetical protein